MAACSIPYIPVEETIREIQRRRREREEQAKWERVFEPSRRYEPKRGWLGVQVHQTQAAVAALPEWLRRLLAQAQKEFESR